jgi:hypothetical protein
MSLIKNCPFCTVRVPPYATVCPHCTRDIDTVENIRKQVADHQRRQTLFLLYALGIIAVIFWLAGGLLK